MLALCLGGGFAALAQAQDAPPAPAASAAPAAVSTAVTDTLDQRLEGCAACHGKQGQGGINAYYPHLAGKPADYLYDQLKRFQAGTRHYAQMTYMVRFMDDAYMHEIANYYAQQKLTCMPVEAARPDLSGVAAGEPIPAGGAVVAAEGGSSVPPCSSKQ
ncbi:c-type cytochrome [Frateuria aurantia]